MRKLILVAAIGKNKELGYKNNLIWKLKDDLVNFKNITTGHYVLMGKNTYDSLPKRLPNRKYLILSKSIKQIEDAIIFRNIEDFLEFYKEIDEEVYVIGGSSVYNELISYVDEMILTEINDFFKEADVYFPEFNKNKFKRMVISKHKEEDISYEIVKYIVNKLI